MFVDIAIVVTVALIHITTAWLSGMRKQHRRIEFAECDDSQRVQAGGEMLAQNGYGPNPPLVQLSC